MALNVGIILTGCGPADGSDIQEAVFTAISLEKSGVSYTPFAPLINFTAIDGSQRECMSESARIFGHIRSLADLPKIKPDALIIPGGAGVLKNLYQHTEKAIFPMLAEYMKEMCDKMKPFATLGYASLIPAAVFSNSSSPITLAFPNQLEGENQDNLFFKEAFTHFNTQLIACSPSKVVIDDTLNIVSTPGFLAKSLTQRIATDMDVFIGIEKATAKLIEFCNLRTQS